MTRNALLNAFRPVDWARLLVLTACGWLVNQLPLTLFPGIHFAFGGVFILIIVRCFGLGWGIPAALFIGAFAPPLFGNGLVETLAVLEALLVGVCLRRGWLGVSAAGVVFWCVLGMPSVLLVAVYAAELSHHAALFLTFKGGANGITNAILAGLLLSAPWFSRLLRPHRAERTFSVRSFQFHVSSVLLLAAALMFLGMTGRDKFHDLEAEANDRIQSAIHAARGYLASLPPLTDTAVGEVAAPRLDRVVRLLSEAGRVEVLLMDDAGRVAAASATAPDAPPPDRPGLHPMLAKLQGGRWSGERSESFRLHNWENSQYMESVPLDGPYADRLVVRLKASPLVQRFLSAYNADLATGLSLLLIGFLAASLLAQRVVQPLVQLTEAIGNAPQRMRSRREPEWPHSGVQEVDRLTNNVQDMTQLLRQQLDEAEYARHRLALANESLAQQIAARRRTEESLRESETWFRRIVWHSRELFWIAAPGTNEKILYLSPAAEEITGVQWKGEKNGLVRWHEPVHPDDRERMTQATAQHVATGELDEEYRIVHPDGSVRWLRSRGFPLRNEAGEMIGSGGITEDITERKRAYERLQAQQSEIAHIGRMSLAGEMAAMLAHELNQPLAAIVTYTDACLFQLESGKSDTEKLKGTMRKVSSQGLRAGEIIRQLRSFVRRTEPKQIPLDVNTLIQEVERLAAVEARHQGVLIHLAPTTPLPRILADKIQIQQVVLNLMRNGIEAMADAGAEQRHLTVSTSATPAHEVVVSVADTGPGLSEEWAEKLFRPFYTTKPSGMGLGLSISQSIVEAHGGRLWATQNEDGGAVFCFSIPAAADDLPRVTAS